MVPHADKHRGQSNSSCFHRYVDQLGRLIHRQRAVLAAKVATAAAELSAEASQRAMVEAQAASRAKSEFLANMSHELRTPLNAILGFSEIMMLGASSPVKIEEYAQNINGAAQHLLALINDILDLARIEAGKLEVSPDLVDASSVLTSCCVIVCERAARGGVKLAEVACEQPVVLWADERKLKQIIINLLSNAVKFTPAGGKVTAGWTTGENGWWRLTVKDTGIGIRKDDLDRIFEPFIQVDSRLNRKYEGAGLGLPLTRRLVERHGGKLIVESELGIGTTVVVELPAPRDCAANQDAETAPDEAVPPVMQVAV